MIAFEDIYKVVVAMVPLYVALVLGYGSVKWWRIFSPEQSDGINRLVCYFTLPLFTFDFTVHINPYKMNFLCIAADAISKVIIVGVIALWAKFSSKGSYCWSITSFSLSTLTNSLVVGVPLLRAMYGQLGEDLVVQFSVLQAIIWLTVLLFVLEFRRSTDAINLCSSSPAKVAVVVDDHHDHINIDKDDLEGSTNNDVVDGDEGIISGVASSSSSGGGRKFWSLMKVVWLKLALNPNSYACIVGIAWACVANRWHFELPSVVEGSVLIMSKAGTGTAMFSMGMFMASQEKIIACGPSLTLFGMVLRFIAGPAAMAIGAVAVGLNGDVLRIAIIQAALPQSITSFIYAKEYGLHADVLSTAVIFGMLASLPVLVGFYAGLEILR